MKGSEEICKDFQQEQSLLKSMKHIIEHITMLSDRIYVQNGTTYVVEGDPNEKEIKIKLACVFWMNINDDKPTSIDVYLDPTPLIETFQMVLKMNQNINI